MNLGKKKTARLKVLMNSLVVWRGMVSDVPEDAEGRPARLLLAMNAYNDAAKEINEMFGEQMVSLY